MTALKLSGLAQVVAVVTLLIHASEAVDLCEQGYKAYFKEYGFLLDSFASIVPHYFASSSSSSEESYDAGPEVKEVQNAKSARACARQCCLWDECSMMVYETTQKACTLVICDSQMLKSGACKPVTDAVNTKLFAQLGANVSMLAVSSSNASNSSESSADADDNDGDDIFNLIGSVPQRYVTVYFRLRSSLLKGYLDMMRTVAAHYPLQQLVNSSGLAASNSSQNPLVAVINRLQNQNVSLSNSPSHATFNNVTVQPCEVDNDCTEYETCSYANSGKKKSKSDSGSDSDSDSDSDSEEDYDDYDETESESESKSRSKRSHSSMSSTEMQSMMASFEDTYNEVDVDDDAGICVCRDGYLRVNASAYSTGTCVADPSGTHGNSQGKHKHSHSHSQSQSNANMTEELINLNETLADVETESSLMFGLLSADMEGANLVFLMIMVVVGILGLLFLTWLCVACKVRIGKCLHSCCDRCNRDETVRNTRVNTTGSRRSEYRALMANEAEADAVADDEDEDVSFERSSLRPVSGKSTAIDFDSTRTRRYDNDLKKK